MDFCRQSCQLRSPSICGWAGTCSVQFELELAVRSLPRACFSGSLPAHPLRLSQTPDNWRSLRKISALTKRRWAEFDNCAGTSSTETNWMIPFVESRVCVGKVLLILAYLDRRMCQFSIFPAHPSGHQPLCVCRLALRPLFQFHNHGLVTVSCVPAANHEIEASRGTREFVFDDYAMVIEFCELDHLRHCPQELPHDATSDLPGG